MADAIVVGAGFGGVHMLYKLRELGFSAIGLEASDDVGGVWRGNRYPGARCDVESLAYSYSFSAEIDAEWRWTERYAAQPEIQRYIAFVADRLNIRPMIRFQTELLTPHGYHIGTRRICVGTDYYETFNRENVTVVDVKSHPIERITAGGLLVEGEEHPVDCLIFATGFDALTGAMTSIDLRGRDGLTIQDAWRHGPQTYLGIAVEGFPNMAMIGGPGSPSVLSVVVQTNEFQVEWIGRLLATMRARGKTRFDVAPGFQEQWTDHVNEVVKRTLFRESDSWYVGANIPGKPRAILAYTGGVAAYRAACENGFPEDAPPIGLEIA